MPRNSTSYKELKRRIDYLSANYLPPSDPGGNYTRKQKDAIRSFLLLSHAELEAYFEQICWNVAKRSLDRWLANHNYKSRVLLYLCVFTEQTEKIKRANSSVDKIKEIVGHYFVQLKGNNGIKRDNILDMLCPLGIDQNQIDNNWLNTIDNFGSNRGNIAHTSARTQTLTDPSVIRKDIEFIINELAPLDILITRLS